MAELPARTSDLARPLAQGQFVHLIRDGRDVCLSIGNGSKPDRITVRHVSSADDKVSAAALTSEPGRSAPVTCASAAGVPANRAPAGRAGTHANHCFRVPRKYAWDPLPFRLKRTMFSSMVSGMAARSKR